MTTFRHDSVSSSRCTHLGIMLRSDTSNFILQLSVYISNINLEGCLKVYIYNKVILSSNLYNIHSSVVVLK